MVVRSTFPALVLTCLSIGLAGQFGMCRSVRADEPSAVAPVAAEADSADPAATKKEALAWLEAFSKRQVLFHPEDVKKLQARVEAMTPEEAAAWWKASQPKREELDSPEWRETESWLKKFLAVQAIYSDDEIRDFQSEAAAKAKVSAQSLQEVLDNVTKRRQRLVGGAQQAEQTRQMQVAANEAFRQNDVRQREEAVRAARSRPAATFPTPAAPPPRERPGRVNEPLIDSLDVARWTVLRELFPRW
jgi:hypothetical protein